MPASRCGNMLLIAGSEIPFGLSVLGGWDGIDCMMILCLQVAPFVEERRRGQIHTNNG